MSSSFRYNLRSDCPICSGSHKRGSSCRSAGDLIFCRSLLPAPEGYRYLGEDPWGFGKYAPGDEGATDEERELARRLRKKSAKERRRAELKELTKTSSKDERDRAIRKISATLRLSLAHRDELKRRGLTDVQIDQGLFFTIPDCKPWERPELPTIPANIPGIKFFNGKKRIAGDGGIACPIWQDGKAIGWQVLTDNRENGKYKWAKGEFSSHLRNRELPLFVQDLSEDSMAWLIEGILKPYVAASRLNIPVVGAAGGNFATSPKQFKGKVSGIQTFVLTPDAGDIKNLHVIQRWERQIQFIREAAPNTSIKVAWWGQQDKEDPDIDELESITVIQFITPEEFLRMGGIKPKQKPLRELSPIQEPDPEEYRQYEEYLRLEQEYAIADEVRRKREWAKERLNNKYRGWADSKRFTPHRTSNAEYCDFEIPEPGTITIIKAGLGAGKSTQLAKVIAELKRLEQVSCFINLGYRNSLLHQFNKLTGFQHIQDGLEALMLLRANEGRGISLCVDSILRLRPEHYEGATILLDEFTSVIRHIIKSKTISESTRKKVLERFADCLNMAERVICLDALASNFFADYLHQLCPTKKIVRWENTYERPKPPIYLYEGSISDVGSLKPSDKSQLYRRMLVQIAKGNRIGIAVDSQKKGEAIDKFLTNSFPSKKGIRIDSKTVAEKGAVEEFMCDASKYLRENGVSWVIFTSSAESGIDINVPGYFSEFYGIFEGVLAVDSIIQMLGRLRDWNVPRYIYVAQKMLPGNSENYPQSAQELLRRQLEKIAHGIDSSDSESLSNEIAELAKTYIEEIRNTQHDAMAWKLASLHSYEANNLRNCVQERLEQLGFGVKVIVEDEDNDNRRAIKEASEEIKLEEATDIHRAEKVDELPEKSWNATWDDRAVEINYFLRKRLPGIDQTPLWNPEGIKFLRSDEPEFIRRQERYMKLKHPHLCNRLLREKIASLIRFPPGILSNWKDESLMIDTLRECGLLEIFESGKEYTNDSPEILDFIRKVSNWKNKRAIGKSQGKDSPIKFVNRLAQLFGLKFVQTRRSTDNKRYYSVDKRITENSRRLDVLNCLETRWRDILTGEKEEIDYTKILVPNTEFVPPGALEDEIALTLTYCDCESDIAKMMEPIKGSLRKIAATVRNATSTFRRNLPDVPDEWVNHWLDAIASYLRSLSLPQYAQSSTG